MPRGALSPEVIAGIEKIEGWLLGPAIDAIEAIASIQAVSHGALRALEIGVWQGKSLTLLSHLYATVTGVDPMVHCEDPDRQYATLVGNLERFGGRAHVTVIRRFSSEVDSDEIVSDGSLFDFVHIDGDHTRRGVETDLELASQLMAPHAVIVLDDMFNAALPGVTEGFLSYQLRLPTLSPFLYAGNKLFVAASPSAAEMYRESIVKWAEERGSVEPWAGMLRYRHEMTALGVPVELCGSPLLVA